MLIIGLVIGTVGGFVIAMYVMRWAVSDLRERASCAMRVSNAREEIVDNQTREIKRLNQENYRLERERQEVAYWITRYPRDVRHAKQTFDREDQ
jgi:hypothetical protein